MGVKSESRELTCGDIRAERNRHLPMVTQEDLAKELDWYTPALTLVENGQIEVTQGQLQAMLDAISRIIARRQEAKA